jgi:hypothetical protein
VDNWERAARVVHEQYRLITRQHRQLDPSKPSHRAWEQLDPFLKESNIRQVTTALAAAESLGRSWGPVVSGGRSDGLVTSADVSAAELDTMAEMEHTSWMKHLQDNGWRYGAKRDDHRRIHPSLRPWRELTPADQEKTREGVANALKILNRLGYLDSAAPIGRRRCLLGRGVGRGHPARRGSCRTSRRSVELDERVGRGHAGGSRRLAGHQ